MAIKRNKKVNTENNIILKSQISSSTFYISMKFPLQLAQPFGLFPIYLGTTHHNLKIKWIHWRMAYSLILLTFAIYLLLLDFIEFTQSSSQSIVFHMDCIAKYVVFFKLTLDWSDYVKEWHEVEDNMKKYELSTHLRNTFIKIIVTIISLGIVEHSLINGSALKRYLNEETTVSDAVKKYFVERNYKPVFKVMEYSHLKGIIIEIIHLQLIFVWNYGDIFIMLIGAALECQLQKITNRINSLCKLKVRDIQAWNSVRNHYLQLSRLCHSTNNKISWLIMTSFLANFYFILTQLFGSLRPIENTLEKMYFYISFTLLAVRLTCVCIFGSGLNVEWENIHRVLQSVHSTAYNTEVERFLENVSTYKLVLTGKNFFSITRGAILNIAGAILTYELVIIQFNMGLLKKKLD